MMDNPNRPISKHERDLLKGKQVAEKMAGMLKKKCPWIKNLKFRAEEVRWESNRQLMQEYHTLQSRTEEQKNKNKLVFGLDMKMTYLDENNKEQNCSIIVKHKPCKISSVGLKSHKAKPEYSDIIEQFGKTWLILGYGGSPESPKAFLVLKIADIPEKQFRACGYKNNRNRIEMILTGMSEWKYLGYTTLFKETIGTELEKIRKE